MKNLILILIFTLNSMLFASGEAGAIFLLISPSPTINGYGGAGTSISINDIYSTYYNPAQSQLPDGLSLQLSDTRVAWLPNIADDIKYKYDVQMMGYNGITIFDKYQLQFSITKSEASLELGEQVATDEFGNSSENFTSYMFSDMSTFSLGIRFKKFPIYFGIGRTNKKVIQVLSNFDSKNNFHDWGFRLSINQYQLQKLENFKLSYSFGYSKSNIGNFVSFGNHSKGDPAPTTARLGMTFGVNYDFYKNLGLDFKIIREAEELMVSKNGKYKDGNLGDINIGKHIINGKADEDVIIRYGSEITLFNFYSIRTGKYIDLEGQIECKTSGYGIDFGELIKSASYIFDDPSMREIKLLDYIELRYNYSEYNASSGHPLDNITFDELTLSIKNIEKIFK